MSEGPTNIFNALTGVSQTMQLRLWFMALAGNSPVSNAFTAQADRDGLSPEGRARKEREDQVFQEQMQQLRERTAQFQEQLDRLEQATAEAVRENEQQLEAARKELERIRERAYEITKPDGEIVKVYRDGDRVRDDGGAEVSRDILRAEDIPAGAPLWSERSGAGTRVDALTTENDELTKFRQKLDAGKEAPIDMSADELDALESGVNGTIPQAVRARYEADFPGAPLPKADASATSAPLAAPYSEGGQVKKTPPAAAKPALP